SSFCGTLRASHPSRPRKHMISICSADHTLHDAPHEFLNGELIPPYESPARIAILLGALAQARLGPIAPPRAFGLEPVRAVHDPGYLDYLEHAYERWVAAGHTPAAVMPDTFAARWMARRPDKLLALPGYYTFDLSAPI